MSKEQERPRTLPVRVENIPAELKAIPRWVGWRWEFADGWRHQAVDRHTGDPIDPAEPAVWGTFDEAIASYRQHHLDGVGLVLAGDGYCTVTLGNCHDSKTGQLAPWAGDLIDQLASYTEVSPTATGVTILARSLLPGHHRIHGAIGVYASAHLLPVTGWRLPSSPDGVEPRQAELLRLYHGMPGEVALTDDEVLHRAQRAKNGAKFAALWGGDVEEYEQATDADLALAGILAFWVQGDPTRVETLFAQSVLGKRRKWVEDQAYREKTLTTAVAGLGKFYQPGSRRVYHVFPRTINNYRVTDDEGEEEPESNARLTAEQHEQGMRWALDLAESIGHLSDWEAAFALARRLFRLTRHHPEQFETAVMAFCEKTGRADAEAFYYDFLLVWEKVKTSDETALEWAVAQARQAPYPLPCSHGPLYADIASVCWHLSRRAEDGRFFFPQPALANALGTYQVKVCRVLQLLKRDNIIQCVDENYQRPTRNQKGKAKEYVFVGPLPAAFDNCLEPSPQLTPRTVEVGPAHPPAHDSIRHLPRPAPQEKVPPAPADEEPASKPGRRCRFAKRQTKKSPFKSKYGDVWLTASHYLAEEMCMRRARRAGRDLPWHYWQRPEWKGHFFSQLKQAKALLKEYGQEAVFRALQSTRGRRVYSLTAPFLADLIRDQQALLEIQRAAAKVKAQAEPRAEPAREVNPTSAPPRPEFVARKTLLSTLRGL